MDLFCSEMHANFVELISKPLIATRIQTVDMQGTGHRLTTETARTSYVNLLVPRLAIVIKQWCTIELLLNLT